MAGIRCLYLCPTVAQVRKPALPAFLPSLLHLDVPLRTLEIAGTGRGFPTDRLASITTLEALRLHGIRAEVDCGNPFRKEGTALFRSREFARLDIDCS